MRLTKILIIAGLVVLGFLIVMFIIGTIVGERESEIDVQTQVTTIPASTPMYEQTPTSSIPAPTPLQSQTPAPSTLDAAPTIEPWPFTFGQAAYITEKVNIELDVGWALREIPPGSRITPKEVSEYCDKWKAVNWNYDAAAERYDKPTSGVMAYQMAFVWEASGLSSEERLPITDKLLGGYCAHY